MIYVLVGGEDQYKEMEMRATGADENTRPASAYLREGTRVRAG